MAGPSDLERRVLGWGAAAPLVSSADLVRDLVLARRPNGALDLACVVGSANLGQDLALALTTLLGADPLDPGFGFDGMAAFAVETSGAMLRERLRASVAKLVAQDPRVRAVAAVDVSDPTGAATRTLSLEVEVDTIVGDGTSLTAALLTA